MGPSTLSWLWLILAANPSHAPELKRYMDQESRIRSVCQIVVDLMVENKPKLLAKIGTDPFTFDGRIIKGYQAIEKAWKPILSRSQASLSQQKGSRFEILDFKAVVARFGKPPKKFSHLPLRKCRFVVCRFDSRPGMMLIVLKMEGAWMVTAITD